MKRFWWVPLVVFLWAPLYQSETAVAEDEPDPEQVEQFKEFLENKGLGSLLNGVWVLDLPPSRSEEDELGSVAYGLERYRIYAEKSSKSPAELVGILGLKSVVYDYIEIPQSDLSYYFRAKPHNQIRILYRHLEQPSLSDLPALEGPSRSLSQSLSP